MVPQNFAVLGKFGFAQNTCKTLEGARLLACSVFRGSFLKMLAARKANFCQCSCPQRKTLCSHARKDHSIPLNLYNGRSYLPYHLTGFPLFLAHCLKSSS